MGPLACPHDKSLDHVRFGETICAPGMPQRWADCRAACSPRLGSSMAGPNVGYKVTAGDRAHLDLVISIRGGGHRPDVTTASWVGRSLGGANLPAAAIAGRERAGKRCRTSQISTSNTAMPRNVTE